MKFSSIINCIIITVAAVFLINLAFHVKTGATADSIAVLKTTGMTAEAVQAGSPRNWKNRMALQSPRWTLWAAGCGGL